MSPFGSALSSRHSATTAQGGGGIEAKPVRFLRPREDGIAQVGSNSSHSRNAQCTPIVHGIATLQAAQGILHFQTATGAALQLKPYRLHTLSCPQVSSSPDHTFSAPMYYTHSHPLVPLLTSA